MNKKKEIDQCTFEPKTNKYKKPRLPPRSNIEQENYNFYKIPKDSYSKYHQTQ